MPSLIELFDYPDLTDVRASILAALTKPEFPITDWESGGVVRTAYEVDASVTMELIDAIIAQVRGGFLGTEDEKGADGDWLTDLARGWYQNDRGPAGIAVQTLTLTCASGYGPYTISQGNTLYQATDGSIYVAETGGALSSASPLAGIEASAQSPGLARGLISSIVPALPGVTVSGAALKVVGGIAYRGADEERDAALHKRCDDRWPSLDFDANDPIQTRDRVTKWAFAASSEITRTRIDPAATNAVDSSGLRVGVAGEEGGIYLYVAGSNGMVSEASRLAAQAYIDDRAPITDWIVVKHCTLAGIIAGGTVTVRRALEEQTKARAEAAWRAYLGKTTIGSEVRRAELYKAVMDTGAIDFTGVTLNGSAVFNVTLAPSDVPVPNATLAASLTWLLV